MTICGCNRKKCPFIKIVYFNRPKPDPVKNNFKVYPYRFVILGVFMLMNLVLQVQWLAHAAVARPAAVFYAGQFDPASVLNIDFLAMLYMVIYVVVSIPASYIIDTHGIRVGLAIGAVLTGVFSMVKALTADSYTGVLIAQIGLSVAQPFILNAVTAVTVRWFPMKERALAAGLSALAQYLGIIIAMLVTPMLIGTDPLKPGYGQGFERMLMVYGLISLAASVLSLILIREHPPQPPAEEAYVRYPFRKGMAHLFRQRDMVITLFLFLIGLGIFNAVSSMTDAITAYAGIQDSNGLIGGLMLIGGIIGAMILPALSDKYRKRKIFLVICLAGMIPGLFGLAFAGRISGDHSVVFAISLVSSFILGFFVMSAGPIGFQYAAEVSYPAPESMSQGLLLWVGQITGILFVAGMSVNHNQHLGLYLALFAGISLLVFAASLFLRESRLIQAET
ncbi:MAG TPA: MFS transporter [Bacteroidales bacterium]|nr:MFS transporter [Bacteroidales bacterium]